MSNQRTYYPPQPHADESPAPTIADSLCQLGVIAQSLRDDGIVTRADDLARVARDIQRASDHLSWLAPGFDPPAAKPPVTATARALLTPSVIEACARAGWAAQVAFDQARDGTPRDGWSWAAVQNAARDNFCDSVARILNGKKPSGGRLFHDVVWATATALLGTCPGAVTGVHAPSCAAGRPPPPETSAAPSPRADDNNLADAAAPVSDAELDTFRSFPRAQRARGPTAMHKPTIDDLRPAVFHIVLLTDGNRRGEYRMICGVGETRVEYRAKNSLDEDLWVSPGSVGTGATTPNPLGFSSDEVASLMGRVIAMRIALPDPPRTITNGAVRHIDLGQLDLSTKG